MVKLSKFAENAPKKMDLKISEYALKNGMSYIQAKVWLKDEGDDDNGWRDNELTGKGRDGDLP